MSGSSSEDEIGDHLFYRDRPDWRDIKPIPQDDEDSVVCIDYSPQFVDVFDYFRAIVAAGEKSKRALKLTQDAVKLNPANYTVWQYRREILQELGEDLYPELDFVRNIILKQPKNYQVWQHRRILVEWLNDPSKEKDITETAIDKDAKNYHAWQHRQWVVRKYSLSKGELEFTEKLIDMDVRNNSAWNHRYFVINNSSGFTERVIDREVSFTLSRINKAKENESSWSYLRGLMIHSDEGLSGNEEITSFCNNLYKRENKSVFLLSIIIDICKEKASKETEDANEELRRASLICDDLANKIDTLRENYWNYIGADVKKLLEKREASM